MGSLINVSVPTRVYEIQLRFQQNKIILLKHVEKNLLTDDAKDEDISPKSPPIISNLIIKFETSTGYHTLNHLFPADVEMKTIDKISLPVGNIKDIYLGYSNGKPADILMSHNSMEIHLKENPKKGLKIRDEEIINETFQEKILEDMIEKYALTFAYMRTSIDGNFIILTVPLNSIKSDNLMNELKLYGIGKYYKSKLSQIPAVLFFDSADLKVVKVFHLTEAGTELKQTGSQENVKKITHWQYLMSSMKSRVTLAQLNTGMYANAVFNFDFLMLMIIAGIIAAVSTFESNTLGRIGSMFISQLVSPMFAQALGLYLRDYKLAGLGLFKEWTGLNIILILGFIGGIFMGVHGPWPYIKHWPTIEMIASTNIYTMTTRIILASGTGCAIAIGTISGNRGLLFGIAMAAALMLPALNAGIFGGLTFVMYIYEVKAGRPIGGCHDYLGNDPNMSIKMDYVRGYQIQYCENMILEFTYNGLASFTLTILNIFVMIVVGIITLWIKGVPTRNSTKNQKPKSPKLGPD